MEIHTYEKIEQAVRSSGVTQYERSEFFHILPEIVKEDVMMDMFQKTFKESMVDLAGRFLEMGYEQDII